MLLLSQQTIGRGWREVQRDEFLQTTDQWNNPSTGEWQVSQFFTSDKRQHIGKVPYRRAVSRGAKISAFWAAKNKIMLQVFNNVAKIWRV